MHLLRLDDDGEIRLVQNIQENNAPRYAILSHSWGIPSTEVTFEDAVSGNGREKAGYEKIDFCAQQARKDDLQYFWVDTCCINKANLAELSESITSMFRWYQKAAKCYVFLDTIPIKQWWGSSFRECKWLTRGWTLQELLAPSSVEFFSRDRQNMGSKHTHSLLIQQTTDIPVDALQGTTPLSEYSPGVKISWAASRRTTKMEDMVYCLQGVFGIHLIPHYGEGDYALERFKREVGLSYENQIAKLGPVLFRAHITSPASDDKKFVETQPGHCQDLVKYIKDHLRVGRGEAHAFEEIQDQILTKANGVFMWTVLVVNILNKEIEDGRLHAIQEKLDQIPHGLSPLLKYISHRDQENLDELLLRVQWLLFAFAPLTPEQFYCAMMAGLHPESNLVAEWNREPISEDDLERFVISYSKGLAEVKVHRDTKQNVSRLVIQFIHESVKDSLIKDRGLCELWPEFKAEPDGRSHDQLRQCCQTYLEMDWKEHIHSAISQPFEKSERSSAASYSTWQKHSIAARKNFPFLDYAASHTLYHAEKAATYTSQKGLLTKSYLQNYNFASDLLFRGESYSNASSQGYQQMTKLLLDAGAEIKSQRNNLDSDTLEIAAERFDWIAPESRVSICARSDAQTDSTCFSMLCDASERGHFEVVKLLLEAGADVNATCCQNEPCQALFAASSGHHRVMRLLLDSGADVNANADGQCNALVKASRSGNLEAVKILLEAGASMDICVTYGWDDALQAAFDFGHEDVQDLLSGILLDTDTVIDCDNKEVFETALDVLSSRGSWEAVKQLLDRDAHLQGCDALQSASDRGHDRVVKLLLVRGVNPNRAGDSRGSTALELASAGG